MHDLHAWVLGENLKDRPLLEMCNSLYATRQALWSTTSRITWMTSAPSSPNTGGPGALASSWCFKSVSQTEAVTMLSMLIAINTSVEVGERGQFHRAVTIQGSEQAIARRVKRLILGLRNQRNSELSTEAHDVMFKFDGWNLYEFFVVQLSPLMGIFMALWWYVYIYIGVICPLITVHSTL